MPSLCFPPRGCVFSPRTHLGGYGIPAIPTPPSKLSSHRTHRNHRSFWRRRASHRFHRCPQMVRLRKVLWLLWGDSLVAAWVWQGCHTLLICAHPCNLWENILRQKLLWFLWVLWEDSLEGAWVWQGCHTLLICAHPCNLW